MIHLGLKQPGMPVRGAPAVVATDRSEFGSSDFVADLMRFRFAGQSPRNKSIDGVPFFVGEFWTARQRQAHALHEVSYRACFKPQLPEFFIERLTAPGDVVYDPFMGRGTTPLQAALMGRCAIGNDINPLSVYLTRPRLAPARLGPIADRLAAIDWRHDVDPEDPLLVFYHPETLSQILALRRYLLEREAAGRIDAADDWIRMVALNRLTGHSPGFFSVYSLPPNQAVSLGAQGKINEKRRQVPPLRNVAAIILKKTRALLKDGALPAALPHLLLSRPASGTPEIADRSVDLVVTSPPFLDIVQYASDNWLRCWFAGIDASSVAMDSLRKIDDVRRLRPALDVAQRVVDHLMLLNAALAFELRRQHVRGIVIAIPGEVANDNVGGGKLRLDQLLDLVGVHRHRYALRPWKAPATAWLARLQG